MSNVRQVLVSSGLSRTEARQLVRTESGMCVYRAPEPSEADVQPPQQSHPREASP